MSTCFNRNEVKLNIVIQVSSQQPFISGVVFSELYYIYSPVQILIVRKILSVLVAVQCVPL